MVVRTGDVGVPLGRAQSLGPLLEASATSIDRDRRLPESLVETLKAQGLLQLLLPRTYGGAQAAPARFVEVVEELARHDASTAWCVGQLSVCAMAAAYLAPASAQRVFEEGRGILAWGSSTSPVLARVEHGGYRVTGGWSFASGGHHATWLGGHCVLADADGNLRYDAKGLAIDRTLLFPAEEVKWADDWEVLGLRGTGSDSYSVDELFVPEEFTLRRDFQSDRVIEDRLYRLRTDNMYACGFAGVALGVARSMLDALIRLAGGKTPRGFRNTMSENAVVQSEIARLEAALRSSRHFLYGTLDEAWSAAASGELPLAERTAVRLASTHCIDQARHVANATYHLAGSDAVRRSGPFERRFRDLNSIAQQMQGRASHYESVGKYLLGFEIKPQFF
ncbi:MAG: acyl-CoA dehydrogenase family protein [Acidimicrobiaceae bacterium]|nr:acyl-CoA dehydrogenase family protein [Acidimicrobiaceae bacterium]MBO0747491.1 acyl-CoA dehydrogenase family protein [Acidimicrobiaceae bacterium]